MDRQGVPDLRVQAPVERGANIGEPWRVALQPALGRRPFPLILRGLRIARSQSSR